MTAYFTLVTPLINTLTRSSEYEADMFGLNASRQPDGFVFFDQPSGRNRILRAMRWKASQVF